LRTKYDELAFSQGGGIEHHFERMPPGATGSALSRKGATSFLCLESTATLEIAGGEICGSTKARKALRPEFRIKCSMGES